MKTRLILRSVLCLVILANIVRAEEKKLGDESDGSRAHPVHLIPLLTEEGEKISPEDDPLLPFSMKETCGACHSYSVVTKGWHFNAADADIGIEAHGRVGQPWILADARTGIQIPISYRPWAGAFRPEEVGLDSRLFLKIFGRHLPGGGIGEVASDDPDDVMRSMISGYLEANCLACHDADAGHNQAEYGGQAVRENFRWAAAATSSFAAITGSAKDMPDTYDPMMPEPPEDPKLVPPGIKYMVNTFRDDGNVLLDIQREAPNHRCYFCHSNMYIDCNDAEKWSSDEDIHLTAGLTCVDCHRNGIDHNIIRGYEGEADVSANRLSATSSCKGCHLPGETEAEPAAGRLGAPIPEHRGLPPVHLEKLTCTACHSGPWPGEKSYLTKTSRAHRLGTVGVNKSAGALPHILSPVFARQADGKIAPHKLIWPSYWADMKGDANVAPIGFEAVRQTVGKAMAKHELPASGDWPVLSDGNIVEALKALAGEQKIEGKAVYVSGGSLYSVSDSGQLEKKIDHPAARPYMWPIAHDVRPAAQALGARRCEDCHSPGSPFFFGQVRVDTPVQRRAGASLTMNELIGASRPTYGGVNRFFKLLIVVVMALLILHIMGDLFRRFVSKVTANKPTDGRKQ